MRPVVLQMGVTLDGFVHGAKGYEDWGLPPEEDEVVAWKVAIGHGAGLFDSLAKPLRMDLAEAHTYPSGTAIKVYRPRVS